MSGHRRALARVNLAAIERNCVRLRSELRDGCGLCVVVKADGYGHGAVQSARAALAAGASMLAVAGAREAVHLRQAGLGQTPLLVMGALSGPELAEALGAGAEVVVWSEQALRAVAGAGGGRVHVKLDSGMGRLGTRDPARASELAAMAAATDGVELAGAMTHFATADEREDSFFERQLEVFEQWVGDLRREHDGVIAHAANSAAVLREPRAHFDMVRCGIAVYGMDPFGEDPAAVDLEPALELASYVAQVKRCAAGQSAGYGRRFVAGRDTHLGVLPIGYGDGWRRALSNNAEALVNGRRRALVGTVSMDNLTIELGPDPDANDLQGQEAVLLGAQGDERILAEELARRLRTINYELTCGLTARVPRLYHRDGVPLDEHRPA
ncbi:MAG TPA: alanine racemase [Solirubrobacteraceae bacterium]|nr:alanine racemase [Solirubrobacteraceae bacterium]